MSFYAQNDRIWISDTNGQLVFDTNNDMPSVTNVIETTISKTFDSKYYHEEYFTLGSTQGRIDFMICRAECHPSNLGTGEDGMNAYERSYNGGRGDPWVNHVSTGQSFFQGSLLLESGRKYSQQSYAQYARRALHVSYEESWGDKIVCMFQQGVKTGYGAVDTSMEYPWGYWVLPDGSKIEAWRHPQPPNSYFVPLAGLATVKWDIKLKIWAGRFR